MVNYGMLLLISNSTALLFKVDAPGQYNIVKEGGTTYGKQNRSVCWSCSEVMSHFKNIWELSFQKNMIKTLLNRSNSLFK